MEIPLSVKEIYAINPKPKIQNCSAKLKPYTRQNYMFRRKSNDNYIISEKVN